MSKHDPKPSDVPPMESWPPPPERDPGAFESLPRGPVWPYWLAVALTCAAVLIFGGPDAL